MTKPQKFQAVISDKKWIAKKVIEVHFLLKNPTEIVFTAGQTVMIYIHPGINRSMSIASSPLTPNELTICWDVSPMGPGAHWLLDHQVGDGVEFMAPLGIFTYEPERKRKSIFMATGTGIAPFRSFLDTYSAQGKLNETDLYWGLRHEEDVFWRDLFEGYQSAHSQFHFNLCLSAPGSTWQGKKGRITEHVFSKEINKDADYYLCGSGAMVEESYTRLVNEGVPIEQIKRELFFN